MDEVEESEYEELKENTKKNIEEGKSSSSSSYSKSEKEKKKLIFEIDNNIQINFINNNNSVINKNVYSKLKNEKKIFRKKNI